MKLLEGAAGGGVDQLQVVPAPRQRYQSVPDHPQRGATFHRVTGREAPFVVICHSFLFVI